MQNEVRNLFAVHPRSTCYGRHEVQVACLKVGGEKKAGHVGGKCMMSGGQKIAGRRIGICLVVEEMERIKGFLWLEVCKPALFSSASVGRSILWAMPVWFI